MYSVELPGLSGGRYGPESVHRILEIAQYRSLEHYDLVMKGEVSPDQQSHRAGSALEVSTAPDFYGQGI